MLARAAVLDGRSASAHLALGTAVAARRGQAPRGRAQAAAS